MRIERVGGFRLEVPESLRERACGLLGRTALGSWEGLWLRRCRSVHTLGMRFAIDVVALDGAGRPLRVHRMAPGRVLLPRPGVHHLVEVAAGRGPAVRDAFAARTTPGGRDTVRPART